jgi:hypothetical protein
MAKLTLNDITSRYGATDALNANFTAIEQAVNNTLSRDGTLPNDMEAHLDMNGNDLLNAGNVFAAQLVINGTPATIGTTFNAVGFHTQEFVATAGQTSLSISPVVAAPSSLVRVYVNGIKLPRSTISFLTSTITIPALVAGDEVEVEVLYAV